jgi:hypothetical protein
MGIAHTTGSNAGHVSSNEGSCLLGWAAAVPVSGVCRYEEMGHAHAAGSHAGSVSPTHGMSLYEGLQELLAAAAAAAAVAATVLV